MLKGLFDQVVGAIKPGDDNEDGADRREHAIRLATAVLMVDVARADHVFDESEHDDVLRLIENRFRLQPEEAAEIFNDATEQAEDLVSLHDFTQLLHESLDAGEKERVVGMLWRVAYADGTLDRFEDSLVLKIGDLLHVQRSRVMRLKHDAAETAQA